MILLFDNTFINGILFPCNNKLNGMEWSMVENSYYIESSMECRVPGSLDLYLTSSTKLFMHDISKL